MKKFYITTSIAYTTANPHIGFALELIQADVLARYNRALGKDTFFLIGTDEHGFRVAEISKKLGKQPKEFADEISAKFKELSSLLNLSNDDFIRTTDEKRHLPAVEKVWKKLEQSGDIYKKKYRGLYCNRCETFITKKDLVNGKCQIHKVRPDIVEEENHFFKLSKYLPKIKEKIEKNEIKIIPQTRKNEVLGFIKQGLEDISFSRPKQSLKWGFSVPGDPDFTIYVWADALSNYISAIGYEKENKKFKKYWPADVHCIGKDILKFHALFWPAMLLSIELPLPKKIFVHGFITVDGQKMSKSLGNVIDPFELVEKYGTDAVRYFLLREISPTEDGDFTYEKFEHRYNSDLASGIGNLLARVRVMADNINPKSQIPNSKQIPWTQRGLPVGLHPKFQTIIDETRKKYKKALEEFKFNEALRAIWDLISFCDKYIEKERPWENENYELRIKNQGVINDLLVVLDNIAELLEAFLPETSDRIIKEIARDKKTGEFVNKRGKLLFPKLN